MGLGQRTADPSTAVHDSLPARIAMVGAACALVLSAAVAVLVTGIQDGATELPPALQAEVAAGRTASRPGIDTYLDVGGWRYQIVSANRQGTWSSSQDEVRPKQTGDELLVVHYRSEAPSVDDGALPAKDSVTVRDESGRSDVPSVTSLSFDLGTDERSVDLIFAVSGSAKRFTLVFASGATVDLTPVMTRES